MEQFRLLGVKIHDVSLAHAQKQVRSFLNSEGRFKVFTPNPEMLVKAQKDDYFKQVLNSGDLNLCDGKGIQFFLKHKIERITGVDFMVEMCKIAEEEHKIIYLLGSGSEEVVGKTKAELLKKFPKLLIAGGNKGEMLHENALTSNDVEEINRTHPDILFVAFGMGKQEKWIFENLAKMPSVKIAMGVGGAFDYISGTVKRAPLLMRNLGLEWLYRLIKQPQRIMRIWNATVKFGWLVVFKK